MAYGFLTSSSKNNSRQTDQARRRSLWPQCTSARHRLCFVFSSGSDVTTMWERYLPLSSPLLPPLLHLSQQHTRHRLIPLESHRRNEACQHHHAGRPRSPESTGARAGHLPPDTVQGEKNNGLAGRPLTAVVAEKSMEGSRTPSEECSTLVPALMSSLSLDAGSSSGRTSLKLSILGDTCLLTAVLSLQEVSSHHNSLQHHHRQGDTKKIGRNLLVSLAPENVSDLFPGSDHCTWQAKSSGRSVTVPYFISPEVAFEEPKLWRDHALGDSPTAEPCPSQGMQCWASHLTSPNLSFLICEMGVLLTKRSDKALHKYVVSKLLLFIE